MKDCSICKTRVFPRVLNFNSKYCTVCKTYFCEDCINQWLLISRTCPVCRSSDTIPDNFKETIGEKFNNVIEKTRDLKIMIFNGTKFVTITYIRGYLWYLFYKCGNLDSVFHIYIHFYTFFILSLFAQSLNLDRASTASRFHD